MRRQFSTMGSAWLTGLLWLCAALAESPSPSPSPSPDTTLQLLHVVFRHGPRTPADTYPNDPHINNDLHPVGWGQLTNTGKLSQYQQGQWLRQRYGQFLGDSYSSKILVAQSTDVDRAKMSAMLELAGLMPPNEAQTWNPDLKWQPIPVNSQPLDQDSLLLVRIPCARYNLELQSVMRSKEVQDKLADLNAPELYSNLTRLTGLSINTPDDVQSLYSTLKAEKEFGLELPEWTHDYYPHKLAPITAYSFSLNAYNSVLRRLKGGPLLMKIITDTKAKVEGNLMPAERKLYLYAGHDSTVSNLLQAMSVWDEQIPDYGILVMIELHRQTNDGQYGIKLYLRNSTEHKPYPLTVPGCGHFCPFDAFVNLTRNEIPDNFKQNCHVDDPNYVAPTPAPP